jgi:hypothetical protein
MSEAMWVVLIVSGTIGGAIVGFILGHGQGQVDAVRDRFVDTRPSLVISEAKRLEVESIMRQKHRERFEGNGATPIFHRDVGFNAYRDSLRQRFAPKTTQPVSDLGWAGIEALGLPDRNTSETE